MFSQVFVCLQGGCMAGGMRGQGAGMRCRGGWLPSMHHRPHHQDPGEEGRGLHRKEGSTHLTGMLLCWLNVYRLLHENETSCTERGRTSLPPPLICHCSFLLYCIAKDKTPPSGLISFIFMQFSAQILPNEKFRPKFKGWCPPPPTPRLGNPGSDTNKGK